MIIHWPYGGRRYLRHEYRSSDVAFLYPSRDSGGAFVPPPTGTHKRPWHNVQFYDGFYQNVIVWQSKGSGGAFVPPPASGTHKRLWHNVLFYTGYRDVFIWQNKGTGGATVIPPPVTGTHKRLYQNVLFETGMYRDVFVWQNKQYAVVPTTDHPGFRSALDFWFGGINAVGSSTPTPGAEIAKAKLAIRVGSAKLKIRV